MEESIIKIRKYILKNFLFSDDETQLFNDTSFLKEGIIDSTGILELITFISDDFSITFEDDEIIPDNLDSVNAVASFISRKQKQPVHGKPETGQKQPLFNLLLQHNPLSQASGEYSFSR